MRRHHLLSTAAYQNPGIQTIMNYRNTPDPAPLMAAALMAEKTQDGKYDGKKLTSYASDVACNVPYWDQSDAIVEGYDAVKAAGRTYLPQFADEENSVYDTRLQYTKFTNVFRDIVEGLASKPFEEEIELIGNVPSEIEAFAEDVDGAGNNLSSFASQTFFNGIVSAYDWIFIDYPTVNREQIRTLADQKAANIKPYWQHVLARNVLEIRTAMVNSKRVLSYMRILEPGVGEPDRVRIFSRDEAGGVTWALFAKDEKGEFILEAEGIISIGVIPMVPFVTGRRDGKTWKVFPPMQDASDLQIKLYQCESGLEYITTLAAYPMLAANGMKPEMMADGKTPKKLKVGPGVVLWGIPNGDGKAGSWEYVEPSAQTMEFLQKKADATKEDLRELGRQPLTAQSGNLTVITTAVAAGKARSAVSAWALVLKDALENALVITARWMAIPYDPEVNVYNEFDNFVDGNGDLEALDKARDRGDISHETYMFELKRRKVLSPEFDIEKERERLLEEIPSDADLENPDDNSDVPPTPKPEPQPGNAV